MGIVTWEVNKEEEMFSTTIGSEVEEKFGMEVSGDGMWTLAAGSDNEGTKIFSVIDDDERVNEGNCRGIFKDQVFARVDWNMGGWTEIGMIGADVKVKVW